MIEVNKLSKIRGCTFWKLGMKRAFGLILELEKCSRCILIPSGFTVRHLLQKILKSKALRKRVLLQSFGLKYIKTLRDAAEFTDKASALNK